MSASLAEASYKASEPYQRCSMPRRRPERASRASWHTSRERLNESTLAYSPASSSIGCSGLTRMKTRKPVGGGSTGALTCSSGTSAPWPGMELSTTSSRSSGVSLATSDCGRVFVVGVSSSSTGPCPRADTSMLTRSKSTSALRTAGFCTCSASRTEKCCRASTRFSSIRHLASCSIRPCMLRGASSPRSKPGPASGPSSVSTMKMVVDMEIAVVRMRIG